MDRDDAIPNTAVLARENTHIKLQKSRAQQPVLLPAQRNQTGDPSNICLFKLRCNVLKPSDVAAEYSGFDPVGPHQEAIPPGHLSQRREKRGKGSTLFAVVQLSRAQRRKREHEAHKPTTVPVTTECRSAAVHHVGLCVWRQQRRAAKQLAQTYTIGVEGQSWAIAGADPQQDAESTKEVVCDEVLTLIIHALQFRALDAAVS